MSASRLPIAPPPQLANVTSSAFSYYGTTKGAGRLLLGLSAGVFSTTLQAARYVGSALVWLFSVVALAAAWPLVQLFSLLRFLLSPVTYTLSYVAAPLVAFVSFLGRLRPLYTYLGSAAFIGIVTGLVLNFASRYVFVILRLDESAEPKADGELESDADADDGLEADGGKISPVGKQSWQKQRPARQLSDKALASLFLPKSAAVITPPAVVKTEDSTTPRDDVWQWLEEYNPNQPIVAGEGDGGGSDASASLLRTQSPGPRGVLSLTIMEESSSE
ncbi:hypothetical protein SPBR_07662 [Sporothrix brasiliensis 5110]|uniref:Uncharacterized protein n=1 Tax=Sporothrix brasiliensis 5110 TaxID=1398154 RepID=A0A0C2IUL0_9PEZI|nr:uncharacterized protein SPBR_07662 [Sporothrix brasiliensis 5110]KIH88652.1 hypothetical protein SPBR_07662 [Sporothrix brasiliensis 5110]